MTFKECVLHCSEDSELLTQFDRLYGTHLSTMDRRSPIEKMIDESTGRDKEALEKFVDFVYDCIWMRIEPFKS